MRRRDFIKIIAGSAAALPLIAHAQNQTKPIVGYLSFTSPDERPTLVAAFRQGLGEAGFVIGQNVAIEYRSAAGEYERLPRGRACQNSCCCDRGHRRSRGPSRKSRDVKNPNCIHVEL